MDTTYRRRTAGRGSRTAGKKRSGGLPAREQRRLIQLGASILLFLLVFLGQGVLPRQMAAWKSIISADMDFQGAVAAFGETVSGGGSVLDALEAFWLDITGVTQPEPVPGAKTEWKLPEPVSSLDRICHPQFGNMPEFPLAGGTPASPEPEPVQEEPVVTAVAQQYSDDGQKLPDNVSLQYYNLGLEETASPVMGSVTSAFDFRDHPVSGEYSFHTAVDIGVNTGTDVLAYADGTVEYIGENDIYGLYVKLDHDNEVTTFYAHCNELLVHKGDTVTCGQVIAKSGETGNATGPHLHFAIQKDGIYLNPVYYLDLS